MNKMMYGGRGCGRNTMVLARLRALGNTLASGKTVTLVCGSTESAAGYKKLLRAAMLPFVWKVVPDRDGLMILVEGRRL